MRHFLFIGLIVLITTACKEKSTVFNGYIDADLVYLSSDFSGRLTELAIVKGQVVTPQQFLFKLEQTGERYHVEMSQLNGKDLLAQRQQIVIQLNYNQINYRRIREMRQQNAASQSDLDAAKRDLNVSQQQLAHFDAKIQSNQVDLKDKKWQVRRKENAAPELGIVFDTYYTQGEYVPVGYPVLSLITKNNIKALFFVPEEQLSQLRLNERIKITTDQNVHFAQGHIVYISNRAEYTPPIIYSREERRRLVFRVEAKIDTPDLEKIHFGQPVTLELIP